MQKKNYIFKILIPWNSSLLYLISSSQGIRYFPKDIFPKATFQGTISQAATSQLDRALQLEQTWKVSDCLENCTFRKLPLSKIPPAS